MTQGNQAMIRVILADDHPLIRAGIRAEFIDESDIVLLAEASNGKEAQDVCMQTEADVLILDLSMPGPSARETVELLRKECPHLSILILTAFEDPIYIRALVSLGVKGYVLKDEATEVIVDAVRTVYHGGRSFSQRVMEKILTLVVPATGAQSNLNAKEIKILELLKDGLTTREIADKMSISERTIRYHLENILQKLNAKNRTEAVANAISNNLIK
jgi:DNA-binding NarL/FixJ family response regulator